MILKNTVLRGYYIAAFVLNLITVISILGTKVFLPPVVPLFYGKPVGNDQLASNLFLLIVPIISFLISILNFIISNKLTDEFIKKILSISSFVVSFMAVITVIKIILLVGFF